MSLPPLPGHRVRIVGESTSEEARGGFVYVRELTLVATFANGEESQPFPYFITERSRLDAVVVLAHFVRAGEVMVVLRSALRPPPALRPREARPVPEKESVGELWEVPAGLVEADERSPEGLKLCACRELLEEIGADVPVSSVVPLGPSTFPSGGLIGERHFFFSVEVDPTAFVTPSEDGSALERHAAIVYVPLHDALEACKRGDIEDAKTEIALRRFAERSR